MPALLVSPVARSMDSYRAGRRFSQRDQHERLPTPPPPQPPKSKSPNEKAAGAGSAPAPPAKVKTHTTLVRALVSLKVASHDTCSFLIRQGRICVNGEMVTDDLTRVDRMNDRLLFNGVDLGTVEAATLQMSEDAQREPRSRRDRPQPDADLLKRGYGPGVDDGFYWAKRRRYGKSL